MLINVTNVQQSSFLLNFILLSNGYDKNLFCSINTPTFFNGLILRLSIFFNLSLACGVRFAEEILFITKFYYRVICYSFFCAALVPVPFFANLFPAPLFSSSFFYHAERMGTVLLFLFLAHSRIIVFKSESLWHYAPDAPCLYRYRDGPALTNLRQKPVCHDVAHKEDIFRYFI